MKCAHFGICGGCAVEGVPPAPAPYAEQLLRKEARVRTILGEFAVESWLPMVPSPETWQYRNKMEFAFGAPFLPEPAGRDVPWTGFVLGMRQAGRYDRIVDLEQCGLISDEAFEILRQVRQWTKQQGLRGYHRRRHEGDLRYLVVRDGRNTGQRMAVLISRSEVSGLEDLQKRLAPLTATAWHGVTQSASDMARAEDMRLLWGPGYIEDRLGEVTYRLSPTSFFQTNTRGAEKLYALLAAWSRDLGGALLDLYCGSGGITLALAKSFDRVIGVDSNAEAIADARENAVRNGLSTVEFVCDDALDFMRKLAASKFSIQLNAVVVDPPRPGLHPKALAALVETNPAHLAYVSCNPESLARDLKTLAPLYRIKSVQPVDLFPNTPHVETVCLMEHR